MQQGLNADHSSIDFPRVCFALADGQAYEAVCADQRAYDDFKKRLDGKTIVVLNYARYVRG